MKSKSKRLAEHVSSVKNKKAKRPIYKDIDAYIDNQPAEFRSILNNIRRTIIKAIPDAEEVISYGIPAFRYHGIVVYFASFKNHYSIFIRPRFMNVFKSELSKYKTSKSAVNVPSGDPVPVRLIAKIVKYIAIENLKEVKAKL